MRIHVTDKLWQLFEDKIFSPFLCCFTFYLIYYFIGGVDNCGTEFKDTFVFGNNIIQTIYLCGNPKPNVSVAIGDNEHVISGSLDDKKNHKYKFDVNLLSKSSHCGKKVKYLFTGYKVLRYEETKSKGLIFNSI